MNGYEFTIRLIEAITWPIVLLVLAFYVRKALPERIGALQKLKVGNLEAEFKGILSANPKSDKEESISDKELVSIIPEVLSIAEISPKAAIPHAWAQLEHKMISTLSRLQGFKDSTMGYRIDRHIEVLRENGYITDIDAKTLHELRKLRNKVSHHIEESDSITLSTAKEYAAKCAYYIDTLDKLK